VDGRPRRQARGRVDYLLRVKVNPDTQPVAVAILEAKAEALPPTHGLEQAKAYAACKRLNVPFAFSSNGHLFVEYDRTSGRTTRPIPLAEFPTPADLRARAGRPLTPGPQLRALILSHSILDDPKRR
jgi:type I restriction enzyme R subunit